MTPALFFVLLYLLLQLGIGVWVSRRIRTETDYLIAGRNLGYTLATFSIFATWFGAETVVGSAGSAYRSGVSLGSAEPFGYGLCLILMGLIFAVPLWRRRLTTLADLFRERYSVTTERVAALILIPSSILWAAAQVRAFGQIISTASAGWNVQFAIGVAALFTIAYTMFGGLLVDAITDVLQGVIVILGLGTLFAFVVMKTGGIAEFAATLEASSQGIGLLPQMQMSRLEIAEEWAIPVLGSVVATELVGRIIATRTPVVARRSSFYAGMLYLVVGLMPLLIGLSAGASLQLADAEQVVPVMARELMPTIAYAAFVGAIISAILSTVDSTLLTASGILSHNLIVPIARVSRESTRVLLARLGVLGFGILAYALALTAEGVYALVEQASAFGSAGALVVICFGLFTSFGRSWAALCTLLTGTIAYLVFTMLDAHAPFLFSLALAFACYVVIGAIEGGLAHVSRVSRVVRG